MKKSELRKLIREVISEQFSQDATFSGKPSWSQIAPIIKPASSAATNYSWSVQCPAGYKWGPKAFNTSPFDGGGALGTGSGWSMSYDPKDIAHQITHNNNILVTGCIPEGVDVAPQNDDGGKPGKGNIPTSPGAFNKPDPLGDAPVGGGGFGTANLGDLPSS